MVENGILTRGIDDESQGSDSVRGGGCVPFTEGRGTRKDGTKGLDWTEGEGRRPR